MIATSFVFVPVFLAFGIYAAIKSIYDKKMESHPDILRLKRRLYQIFPEMKKVRIMKSNSSYTLGKKNIYLCTRDDSNYTYDDNMLTYVFLHELAHSLTEQIGHGNEFKSKFKSLLRRAERYGMYDPNKPHVENYCGYKSSSSSSSLKRNNNKGKEDVMI